jgi:hypothetical protein
MDPITLFAMANAAVSAVKAGCKLYKDIKGAAGEVKEVLKDLDDQFSKLHPPEKPATVEQRNQYVKQKNEVIELNKKAESGQHTGVYQEIGDYLGQYYDNYYKCMAIFEEEEKRAKSEVYEGDASLGKRALQRVLMKKQLEQMGTELREIMVYQSPPELGALHSEVEEMMEVMGKQQKVLMVKQIQKDYADKQRKKRRLQKLRMEIALGFVAIMVASTFGLMIAYVVQDRIEKYPELGTEWRPKTEAQRQRESLPQRYIGR